ncbi:MAG: UDP-N-acetylmuramoyl-tripeptide--D-alanyl-D-alanine ligase [Candidatus Paceibacterota bacterium]|jgi:UDP-N-acetylmuramoyl-tripeptide--D-alanyl-D-alanine ligase
MFKSIIKKIILSILRKEAELVLVKYKPRIVGVTGNVGKTSTKDAIHAVLATAYRVRKSKKSLNSEFGVPLTILGLDSGWGNLFSWLYNLAYGLVIIIFPHEYPEWLILELGADRPGDIKSLASWLPLDIAVVTSVGEVPVHIEFFKTKEALAKEKSQIKNGLIATGTLVLNTDDPLVFAMGVTAEGTHSHKTVTYGFEEEADIRASNDRILYETNNGKEFPEGISFKLDMDGKSVPVRIKGIFGKHHIYAALAAVAVGHTLKINLVTMLEALQDYEKAPGRLRLIEGEKDTIILDDTYNASPLATEKALDSLNELKVAGKKIAVIGDMLELGEHTVQAHEKIGRKVAKICDLLVTAGQRAKFIADGAREAGLDPDKIQSFDTAEEAGKYIEPIIKSGDLILVKGSQGVRMERVVKEIMAFPEEAEKLLVRQEKEWLNRV